MIVMGEENMFFETYYSKTRFAIETIMAVIAMGSNALMLLLTRGNRHRRHYSYFALFRNLLVANVLSSIAQWFTNNLIYLFQQQLRYVDHCHFMMILLSANVISKVFGWVSVMSLLGISVMHCLAVCYPIAYVVQMSTARVHFAIAMSWVMTCAIALVEILVCAGHLTVGKSGNCTSEMEFINTVSLVDTDVTMVTLTLMYTVIVGLCLRIAAEIRRLQRRLNRLCWTDTLQQERGTFRSIVGLTITMILFVYPYHLLYFLSMNFDLPMISHMSAMLYYMNLLPYVKFATDPVFFCRKRIVQWRNVGCIFGVLVCRRMTSDTSREDRGLIEDNNFSAVTVAAVPDDTTGYSSRSGHMEPSHVSTNSPGPRDLTVSVPQTTGYIPCSNTSLV